MKKLYIATWPDGSITILSGKNKLERSLMLDTEGNPTLAIIKELRFEDTIHITTKVSNKNEIEWSLGDYATDAEIIDYNLY
jgi:hypothetical protein